MSQILFVAVNIIIWSRVVAAVRKDRPVSIAISAIGSSVYVICMWIPAHLQVGGILESKLAKAGFLSQPSALEIDSLQLRWALELFLVVGAEWAVWASRRSRETVQVVSLGPTDRGQERLVRILILVGAAAVLLTPSTALEDRADGGQGAVTLLRTALITGLAFMIYYRGFGKRLNWAIVAVGVLVIASGNIRSPLLVLAFAFIASEMRAGNLKRAARLIVVSVLVVCFALGGAFMSDLRANITRNYGLSTSQVLSETLANPWVAPFESGLDTLDGYRLSDRLVGVEPAQPADLLKVITTFVPRALWPDKPLDLSVQLSTKYLNYRGSGQYLSPVGYLSLTLGSYAAGLAGLFIFVVMMAMLARRFAAEVWLLIVLCVAFRFMLGGSAFDLYYGLTLAVPVLVASFSLRLLDRVPTRDGRSRASQRISSPLGNRGPNRLPSRMI